MDCREVKEICSDYLDRRLAPMRMVSIQEHLRICRDCSQEMDELSKTVFLIRSLDEIEPSRDFLSRVHRKITRGRQKKPGIWERLFEPIRIKVPLEVAALVVVSVIGIALYHRSPDPTRTSGERPADSLPAARDTAKSPTTAPSKEQPPGYAMAKKEADSRSKEQSQPSTPGSLDALKDARVEPAIPAPRPQVVEFLVEDVAAYQRKINLLLEQHGGRLLVQEGAPETGFLMTVEVPQTRQGEFLARMRGGQEEKDESRFRALSRGTGPSEKGGSLESSARTDEPMARLHLRILPKK